MHANDPAAKPMMVPHQLAPLTPNPQVRQPLGPNELDHHLWKCLYEEMEGQRQDIPNATVLEAGIQNRGKLVHDR